jgi:hypothetical protein
MDKTSAEQICNCANGIFDAMNKLLMHVNSSVSGERRSAFQMAIGTAIAQIDIHVLESIYIEFPDLRPVDMPEVHRGDE